MHPCQNDYSVAKWAEYFKISTSGYYEWLNNREDRQKRYDEYTKKVLDIFEEGEGTYGADRICDKMRKTGSKSSFDKVKRIMNVQNISSIHNRHKTRSLTNSKKARDGKYKNLVRGMNLEGSEITRPMQVIASDITYIKTGEGFSYKCIIIDVLSGIVLASNTSIKTKKGILV